MEDKEKEVSFYSAVKNNLLNRYKTFLEKESLSNIIGTFLGIGLSIFVIIAAIFISIIDDISFAGAVGSVIGFLLVYFVLIFGVILGIILLPYRIYKGIVSFDKSPLTSSCHKNLIFLGFVLLVAGANEGRVGATLPLPFSLGGLDIDFVKGFLGIMLIFITFTYVISLYGDGIRFSSKDEKQKDSLTFGYVNTPYLVLNMFKYLFIPIIVLYPTFVDIWSNTFEQLSSLLFHIRSMLVGQENLFERLMLRFIEVLIKLLYLLRPSAVL